jgi:tRNA nucleotidyltransferase (CCA-adding enzyme)
MVTTLGRASARLPGPGDRSVGRLSRRDDLAMPGSRGDLIERLAALPAARPLLDRLSDTGGVYVVGGAVRDLLRGQVPRDLDLIVDGELEPVSRRLGTPHRSHDRFDTATVVLDGATYDLARARREVYAQPGALPSVSPAPIEEDLGRRDFTVNALALGLGGSERGRLLAVPGALEDLDAGRLRVLHDASFVDDPTRLLRLARYAARLGFSVEPGTRQLADAALATGALNTVSGARVGAELRLLAAEADPVGAFVALHELGADAAIAPGFGVATPSDAALARRGLELLPADGDPGDLVLGVAAAGVVPARLPELLDRLAFPAPRRDTIIAAATRAASLAEALESAHSPSQIAAAVGSAPVELVALAGARGPAQTARRWLGELRHVNLEIDGDDLLDAGIARGPAVGAGLAAARAAKLDGRAVGRAAELAEALRAARASGQ